jgi:hypothetical protein
MLVLVLVEFEITLVLLLMSSDLLSDGGGNRGNGGGGLLGIIDFLLSFFRFRENSRMILIIFMFIAIKIKHIPELASRHVLHANDSSKL